MKEKKIKVPKLPKKKKEKAPKVPKVKKEKKEGRTWEEDCLLQVQERMWEKLSSQPSW